MFCSGVWKFVLWGKIQTPARDKAVVVHNLLFSVCLPFSYSQAYPQS